MNWLDQRPDDAMTGAFEAIGPEPVAAADAKLFREALSRYGAAVHVVTTDGAAGRTGFTATAVCSVSDDPPTLLVCLNRKSQTSALIAANRTFCVNTLPADAEALSDVFAGRTGAAGAERFKFGTWTTLSTGAPALTSAIAACDCRLVEIKAVASHNVIFGVVETVALGPDAPALVYRGRAYRSL